MVILGLQTRSSSLSPSHTLGDVTYAAASIMIVLYSVINPLVYAPVNQRFREKIKGTISFPCRPNNRIYAETEPQNLGGTNSVTNPTPHYSGRKLQSVKTTEDMNLIKVF